MVLPCPMCTSCNTKYGNLNPYHKASLDPLTQTGSVDSRLNTDKNVLITQIFVFFRCLGFRIERQLFVIKNVWHPGCSTSSCYF